MKSFKDFSKGPSFKNHITDGSLNEGLVSTIVSKVKNIAVFIGQKVATRFAKVFPTVAGPNSTITKNDIVSLPEFFSGLAGINIGDKFRNNIVRKIIKEMKTANPKGLAKMKTVLRSKMGTVENENALDPTTLAHLSQQFDEIFVAPLPIQEGVTITEASPLIIDKDSLTSVEVLKIFELQLDREDKNTLIHHLFSATKASGLSGLIKYQNAVDEAKGKELGITGADAIATKYLASVTVSPVDRATMNGLKKELDSHFKDIKKVTAAAVQPDPYTMEASANDLTNFNVSLNELREVFSTATNIRFPEGFEKKFNLIEPILKKFDSVGWTSTGLNTYRNDVERFYQILKAEQIGKAVINEYVKKPKAMRLINLIHPKTFLEFLNPKSYKDNYVSGLSAVRNILRTRPTELIKANGKVDNKIGLTAYIGLFIDDDANDPYIGGKGAFSVLTTCPGAGKCTTFCFARDGQYTMGKAHSVSAAQILTYLLNDPEGFEKHVIREIRELAEKYKEKYLELIKDDPSLVGKLPDNMIIRWHDTGDFFNEKYLSMAFRIADATKDLGVAHYAYSKMVRMLKDKDHMGSIPENFLFNYSFGSKHDDYIDSANDKHSYVIPYKCFNHLISRAIIIEKGKNVILEGQGEEEDHDDEDEEEGQEASDEKGGGDEKEEVVTRVVSDEDLVVLSSGNEKKEFNKILRDEAKKLLESKEIKDMEDKLLTAAQRESDGKTDEEKAKILKLAYRRIKTEQFKAIKAIKLTLGNNPPQLYAIKKMVNKNAKKETSINPDFIGLDSLIVFTPENGAKLKRNIAKFLNHEKVYQNTKRPTGTYGADGSIEYDKTFSSTNHEVNPDDLLLYVEWDKIRKEGKEEGKKWYVIVPPGYPDVSATTKDVLATLLLEH